MDDSRSLAIFAPLHENIFRAFDYARESDVYDALARSVDGPLLDTVYNEVYSGLILREEGGALCRVKTLTPIESRVVTPASSRTGGRFTVRARWQVEGVVYHWGHSHTRTSEYLAEYAVEPRPGGWRVVALMPLEQRRIETEAQSQSPAAVGGRIGSPASDPPTPPSAAPSGAHP